MKAPATAERATAASGPGASVQPTVDLEAIASAFVLALLRALEQAARDKGLNGLCLNVRSDSPAVRLYNRAGLALVENSDVPNRIGGVSIGLLLRF